MLKMNYVDLAKQYYEDALKIKSVVTKYEEELKKAKRSAKKDKLKLKNKIISYRLIYRDLRNTGDLLMRRANDVSIKTNITIS